jgi:hypothetical protein
MQTLTKENFWNLQQKRTPLIMERFCKWIDEYKKQNNWGYLFSGYKKTEDNGRIIVCYGCFPKYHEIPLAMQIGIFLQFVAEYNNYGFGITIREVNDIQNFHHSISYWMQLEETRLEVC